MPAQVAHACHSILAKRVSGVHRMAGDFCGEYLEVREAGATWRSVLPLAGTVDLALTHRVSRMPS